MIEVGSFIGMAAMCGDGIRIKNVSVENLGIIPDAFRRLGIKIKVEGDDLWIPRQKHYEIQSFIDGTIMTLADAPWPGLTPDLLSVLIVVATQARGSVAIIKMALDKGIVPRCHFEDITRADYFGFVVPFAIVQHVSRSSLALSQRSFWRAYSK